MIDPVTILSTAASISATLCSDFFKYDTELAEIEAGIEKLKIKMKAFKVAIKSNEKISKRVLNQNYEIASDVLKEKDKIINNIITTDSFIRKCIDLIYAKIKDETVEYYMPHLLKLYDKLEESNKQWLKIIDDLSMCSITYIEFNQQLTGNTLKNIRNIS